MTEIRNRLGRIDWAVMLGCAALVLMTLGAVGETGRRRAKEAVCQSNLRQWYGVFQGYVEDNDGQFFTGVSTNGYWWLMQLPRELQDWKRNRTWFCPVASVPMVDERGTPMKNATAWGVYHTEPRSYRGTRYELNPNGVAGSYGLNGYLISIPEGASYDQGISGTDAWRGFDSIPDADGVPMFVDARRFDLWPRDHDAPSPIEYESWMGLTMAECCLDRHDGAMNCLFVDGSVRKVGLKELWTLKWHRSFNVSGPWTKAGGVLPENWPEWMRPFKDY